MAISGHFTEAEHEGPETYLTHEGGRRINTVSYTHLADDRPVCGRLSELGPLTIEQVRRTPHEALFNGLVEQYHYLGYEQPVLSLIHISVCGARPSTR